MAQLSKKTIQHFAHSHPLTELSTKTEFLCDGCKTLGSGKRYRCEACDFDLHDHCGTCPMELSSFMHDEHVLKLVRRRQNNNYRVCNLCGDPVEGLFYRCNLCDFDVHPLCTQLPQYVRHVMHKDHPLSLQGSVPGKCMVCKYTCTSWHYRCGICKFDLHLECILAPAQATSKEKIKSTTSSTSRSLKSPVPPPSAPPFFYSYGYGHGAVAPPFFYAYGYGHGAVPPPPFATGVPIAQPYVGPYNYVHGYGIPYTPAGVCNVNGQHSSSSQAQSNNGKVRKKMYAIAGKLALGVLSSVVFGAPLYYG